MADWETTMPTSTENTYHWPLTWEWDQMSQEQRVERCLRLLRLAVRREHRPESPKSDALKRALWFADQALGSAIDEVE